VASWTPHLPLEREDPGFESRLGVRFLGKHSSDVAYKMT
jgi:hypothetical protein